MTICYDCINELYAFKLKELGTEIDAAKDICRIYYLYWNPEAFEITKAKANVPRMNQYLRNIMMTQYCKGTCWDDYVFEQQQIKEISIQEDNMRKEEEEAPKKSTQLQILRWGKSFTPEEHQNLDAHYDLLVSIAANPQDQDPIIKTLCETDVLKSRAMEHGNIDSYKKLAEVYKSFYGQLERKEEKDSKKDYDKIPFGVMVAIAEEHAPAEYYKDVEMFKDFSGIAEYVKCNVFRPLKNLLTGDTEKDPENVIKESKA